MDCVLWSDESVEAWFARNRDAARAMSAADVDLVGAWLPVVGVPANDDAGRHRPPLLLIEPARD